MPVDARPVTVSLVGSTGSIGTQALDVVAEDARAVPRRRPGAQRSVDLLVAQARRFRPELVAIGDAVPGRRGGRAGSRGHRGPGRAPTGWPPIATRADVVVNGVVGFAGLPVTLAALEAGRRLALANKESLIAGAPVVQRARRTPGRRDRARGLRALRRAPVPARSGRRQDVARLLLTASGGPFRGRTAAELADGGVEDALAHPTWSMGPKITVDSSTLMNKGLEVIEAHELFGVPYDPIDVVVHPQSIVHSMVEFVDGAMWPSCRCPTCACPSATPWPGRAAWRRPSGPSTGPRSRSWSSSPPTGRSSRAWTWPTGPAGPATAPAWLNAANEVAVAAFLDGRSPGRHRRRGGRHPRPLRSDAPRRRGASEDVLDADAAARRLAGRGVAHGRSGGVSAIDLRPAPDGPGPDAGPPPATPGRRPSRRAGWPRELSARPSVLVVAGRGHRLVRPADRGRLHHRDRHAPRAGSLHGGQAERDEGHRVLHRLRAPAVVVPTGRDRVRDQGTSRSGATSRSPG